MGDALAFCLAFAWLMLAVQKWFIVFVSACPGVDIGVHMLAQQMGIPAVGNALAPPFRRNGA
uniref:Uncharacterized protein n=1 Tax=Anguilla anguilla TaxID=7936 RepID=A0A0E9TSF1_ANGAN